MAPEYSNLADEIAWTKMVKKGDFNQLAGIYRFMPARRLDRKGKVLKEFSLHKEAIDRMAKMAKSFEQWKKVHLYAREENIKSTASINMANTAKTFEQWQDVYWKTTLETKEHSLKEIAWTKMQETANTIIEYEYIYQNALPGSEIKKIAWSKMWEEARSDFALLKEVILQNISKEEDDLRNTVMVKMLNIANCVRECKIVYELASPKNELQESALVKMIEIAEKEENFYSYKDIYEYVPEGNRIKNMALQGMFKEAEDFNDYKIIYEFIYQNSELNKMKEMVINGMIKTAKEFFEWYYVYNKITIKTDLKKTVWQQAAITAKTVEDYCLIYEGAEEDEVRETILRQMFNLLS